MADTDVQVLGKIMSKQYTDRFLNGRVSNSGQAKAIEILKNVADNMRTDETVMTRAWLAKFGSIARSPNPVQRAKEHGLCEEKYYWQLCQFLRHTTPKSRINEAVPYVEVVLGHFNAFHQGRERDWAPMLYLGVAHESSGNDAKALAAFRDIFCDDVVHEHAFKTALWARASYSRLLRRMGKISEAETHEQFLQSWLLGHPFTMPPNEFRSLVTNQEVPESHNYVLDNPEVQKFFANTMNMGNGFAHFG